MTGARLALEASLLAVAVFLAARLRVLESRLRVYEQVFQAKMGWAMDERYRLQTESRRPA